MDSPTQPSPPLLDPPHSPHSAIPPHVFVASPLPACCFDFSEEKREVNFAVALVALSRNVQRSDRGTVAATASHCIFEWMEQSRVWEGRPGLLLPRARQPTFTITIVAGAGLEVDVVPLSTRPSFSLSTHLCAVTPCHYPMRPPPNQEGGGGEKK